MISTVAQDAQTAVCLGKRTAEFTVRVLGVAGQRDIIDVDQIAHQQKDQKQVGAEQKSRNEQMGGVEVAQDTLRKQIDDAEHGKVLEKAKILDLPVIENGAVLRQKEPV